MILYLAYLIFGYLTVACVPIVSLMEQLSHDEMIAYLIFLKVIFQILEQWRAVQVVLMT